jgi:nucleoside-diphosphate-sugar epimerase
MKIFLTGGTGFIGSHFINSAHREGYDIVALRAQDSIPRLKLEKEPYWIEGLLDQDYSYEMKGCEALVHFAAHSSNPPYDSIEKCLYWNFTSTLQLFNHAEKSGIKNFIVAGTCFEYGLSGEEYDFIPTNALLKPINSYPISKAALSSALYGWTLEKQVKLQILRIFQVFGEGELENRLWPSLKKSALKGEDYPMTKGEQIRDFIHVDEVVNRFLDALKLNTAKNGILKILNIGTGRPMTVLEFASYWWNKWEAKGELNVGSVPYRENEVMRFVPEVERND